MPAPERERLLVGGPTDSRAPLGDESIRQARLVAIGRDCARFEFDAERCARCEGLCGLRGETGSILEIPGPVDLPLGSRVRIGVPRRHLMYTSLWLFGLPLLGLFAGPVLTHTLFPAASEVALAMTGVGGSVAAAWVALRLAARRRPIEPRLVGLGGDGPASPGETGSLLDC